MLKIYGMKFPLLKFLLLVLLVGCLTACEQENEMIVHEPGQRTVLIYFVADNNLAAYVADDLDELKAGIATYGLFDSQHVLAYVDRGGQASLIELVEQNGVAVEKIVKTYPDRNSTGVAEMQEVFDDVFQNEAYQAESYGFVYWSHGDGWMPYPLPATRWVGQDTGSGDNRMNLSELKQVLDSAPHFDFIMFDACFMQSVEVAYELRDYADYYIASPTETPGPGAPYDAIFPYMLEKGASEKLAEAYFNVYQDMYQKVGTDWQYGVSIAVVKTSELEQLASVTQQVLQGIESETDCSMLRKQVFDYDKRILNTYYVDDYIGYYDFQNMMESLLPPSNYEEWKSSFVLALIYWSTTPQNYSSFVGSFSMTGANGVSHYIPSSPDTDACEAYRSLAWYEDAGISRLW